MLSLDVFTEILVVGLLVLLSVSPILIRLSPTAAKAEGLLPGITSLAGKSVGVFLALVLAYSLGIAANCLVENTFAALGIDPGSQYRTQFERWAKEKNDPVQELEIAEFFLITRSDALKAWSDRHRLYIRVLRAASFSLALLIITMLAYTVSKPQRPRYYPRHFLAAIILFIVFSFAYWLQSTNYKERVYDLYKGLSTSLSKGAE